MKIVTVSQMQQAERDCAKFGISLDRLMENAGKAVAEEIRKILDSPLPGKSLSADTLLKGDQGTGSSLSRGQETSIQKQNILVLVGPGNNGGDGLVAARHLHDWGAEVKVYLCGSRPENDANLEQVKKRNLLCVEASKDNNFEQLNKWLWGATAMLDAIFGTGKSRPLTGVFAQVLNIVSECKKHRDSLRLMALDLPSGLNADTGAIDPATPMVDITITLGFPKIGLFNLPGAERCGKINVVDIGIPQQLVDYVNIELLTDSWARSILPERLLTSHKGTYGKVLALVGSENYLGAAYLACTSSLRVGAGLTTLAIARSLAPIEAAKLTEVTYLPLPEVEPGVASVESEEQLLQQLRGYNVLLLGCGLGQRQPTLDLIRALLLNSTIKLPPAVIDADGLNTLAKTPNWQEQFKGEAIFTPHAGEMARLLNKPTEEIQSHRWQIAQEAASEWQKIVVLKGAYTVIASPDGQVRISPFANPGLASAGTGDVLAGAIAGMAAQNLPLFEAAASGVYLHAQAGEIVRAELGDAGMLASDLLLALPKAIRQLKQG